MIFALFGLDHVAPSGRSVVKITGVDTVSYYSVSRSLLFDHDVDLANEFEVLQPIRSPWNSVVPQTGRYSSPFPIGFSLLQMPFIALGAAVDRIAHGSADGYSRICVCFFFIGTIVYLCIALTLLFVLLRSFGASIGVAPKLRDRGALLATLAIWPSTTLGYYTFSPMSHVVSFMSTVLFLTAWWMSRDSTSSARWVGVGIASGLMFLCRWQEALWLTIPLIWEIVRAAKRERSQWRPWAVSRLACVVAGLITIVPQLLEWKAIYGRYLTIPQGEGFISMPPAHALEVLASSCNGWFTWTPITLLGVAGLLFGLRRSPVVLGSFLGTLALEVILVGSLSTWHGHSFAMRYLTPCVIFVAFGLALLMWTLAARGRLWFAVAAAACTIFTLLFAAQVRLDLIPAVQRLSFQQMFSDKVHLGRARARRKATADAQRQLQAGNAAQAFAFAQEAERHYGADAELLTVAVEAQTALGNDTALATAKARLARFNARRLF
jgi:MFS family permease